tara:strand:+ start:379 stop:510 length:132 start_codon:yes stop_codon:yes gene_type:complete
MRDAVVLAIILAVAIAVDMMKEPTKVRIHIDSSFCDVEAKSGL